MKPRQQALLLDYYNQAAQVFVADVEPVVAPLAEGLVQYAELRAHERVLDLGTGSGLAAREAARISHTVFALDLSRQMLNVARSRGTGNLLQMDMHHMGIPSGAFNVALASFAFNSTDPACSFPEALRILVRGGRLVLQEWGVPDPLSELVTDTIAGYAVENPPPTLAAMRAAMETPLPWDGLDSAGDIVAAVEQAGFHHVQMALVSPPVRVPGIEPFVRYKLAWPGRRAELDALPEEIRWLCLNDLRENLAAHAEDDDSLIWRPEIIRIRAFKPPA